MDTHPDLLSDAERLVLDKLRHNRGSNPSTRQLAARLRAKLDSLQISAARRSLEQRGVVKSSIDGLGHSRRIYIRIADKALLEAILEADERVRLKGGARLRRSPLGS